MNHAEKIILVVEDNKDISEMMRLGLELEGYQVLEAVDGIQAFEVLGKMPLPDLILLDMLMPRMNGREFLDRIKADPSSELAKIPILAVTATTDRVQKTPGELQGILKKPVGLTELFDMIEKTIAK